MHPDLVADAAGREHAEAFMKRLNSAYAEGRRGGDRQPRPPVGILAVRARHASRLRPRAGARTPRSRTPSSDWPQARDSDLARLMEDALAATMAGRDLLAELREQAEIDLARARARLAELDT